MVLIAVLTIINTPTVYAAPITDAAAPAAKFVQGDPDAPKAPVGSHTPLLLRRGESIDAGSLTIAHPKADESTKTKRADATPEDEEEGVTTSRWFWSDKAEGAAAAKDSVEGFKVRVQSHGKGSGAVKEKGGEGGDDEDGRWKFKRREIHQGGESGHTRVDEWVGRPAQQLKPSKKRALDSTRQMNDRLESRAFRKWNFKREVGGVERL